MNATESPPLRVLLGYPSDAAEAADFVARYLTEDWNRVAGPVAHRRVEVAHWLQPGQILPGRAKDGAQGAINEYLLQDADAVILLFVNKLGSPCTDSATGHTYESGTVAEAELAAEHRKVVRIFPASSNYGRPPTETDTSASDDPWLGPSARSAGLRAKLAEWASSDGTDANGYVLRPWDSLEHLALLVGSALSDDLQKSRIGLPTLEEFCRACSSSIDHTIQAIKKYDEGLFVPRENAEREFADFMASASPALALTGAAGMGKTNQLCHMASERGRIRPALLIRGANIMPATRGLWGEVLDALRECDLPQGTRGRLATCSPTELLDLVDAWMEIWDTELVVYIDGINESTNIAELRQCLGRGARQAANRRVRLVMSCRDVDWPRFEPDIDLVSQLYSPPDNSSTTRHRLVLEQFNDNEFAEAWRKYSARFCLSGVPEPDLARLCHDPLMLRFLSEGSEHKEVPRGASRESIFKNYVHATFKGTNRDLWQPILSLALAIYRDRWETDTAELEENEALRAVGSERDLERIRSLNIIVGRREDIAGRVPLSFKYGAFFEYVLAQALVQQWKWLTSTRNVEQHICSFIRECRRRDREAAGWHYHPFLQGSLLYLLLELLSRTDISNPATAVDAVYALLERAAAGQDPTGDEEQSVNPSESQRWKTFFCAFTMSDPTTGSDLIGLFENLALDHSSAVRWSAGMALGTLAAQDNGAGPARALLAQFKADGRWCMRETAAVALRQRYVDFGELAETLERLADDINWRVRRQAGNTLGDLCQLSPKPAIALLHDWSCSENWRLRRAVVQARVGLMTDPALAMDILQRLAFDRREEIRWRSVNVLVNLAESRREYTADALAILKRLASSDNSTWVRRHVAYWLPDIYRACAAERLADSCGDLVQICIADPHQHVRWAAARAIGSFAASNAPRALKWLGHLETDPRNTTRVAFAVRYSRSQLEQALSWEYPDQGLSRRRSAPPTIRQIITQESPEMAMQAKVEELARSLRAPQRPDMINSTLFKNDRYTNIHDAVSEAFGSYAEEQPETLVHLLATDEDEGLRWGTASALGKQNRLLGHLLESTFVAFSHDYQYWVRRETLSALANLMKHAGTIMTERLLSLVYASSDDEEAEVRSAGLSCLVQLCKMHDLPARELTIARRHLAKLSADSDRQVKESALFAEQHEMHHRPV